MTLSAGQTNILSLAWSWQINFSSGTTLITVNNNITYNYWISKVGATYRNLTGNISNNSNYDNPFVGTARNRDILWCMRCSPLITAAM